MITAIWASQPMGWLCYDLCDWCRHLLIGVYYHCNSYRYCLSSGADRVSVAEC